VELRVQDGRAVLAGVPAETDAGGVSRTADAGGVSRTAAVGDTGDVIRAVDPRTLPLAAGLADALHEWAKVADAVARAESAPDGVASALVARRGRQLAGRLATAMGEPVEYVDPLTDEVIVVEVPEAAATADSAPTGWRDQLLRLRPDQVTDEPTPWATGLTVTGFTAAVVCIAMVALSLGLGETSQLLALFANVMVVAGLAPSVWLTRNVLIWRWVAYGVVLGLVTAWIALLFTLL
jgi:hypothetical protein